MAPPGGISNIFNADPEPLRPSSRVLARPGGPVSDIFSDEPLPVRNIQVDPRRFESHIKLGEEAAEEPKLTPQRRDPNWSNDQPEEMTPGRRQYGNTNESHFSLGAEQVVAETQNTRFSVNHNQSQVSLGSEEAPVLTRPVRRDPNATSEEAPHRPSSRVLQRPGGHTSFSLA